MTLIKYIVLVKYTSIQYMSAYTYNSAALFNKYYRSHYLPTARKNLHFLYTAGYTVKNNYHQNSLICIYTELVLSENKKIIRMGGFLFLPNFFNSAR
jgi:hypothetical protein